MSEIRGFKAFCTGGEVGKVSDLYFDDEKWIVRYLIVDTGSWLTRHSVLISPLSVEAVSWETRQIRLSIDREKVEKSPDIDYHKPISRQQEAEYHSYYGYPYYWADTSMWELSPIPAYVPATSPKQSPETPQEDNHLRSTNEIIGCQVKASDGEIGRVRDLLVDEDSWGVKSIVIDEADAPEQSGLDLPVSSVLRLSWTDRSVYVNVSRDEIRPAAGLR
jgi:sporulation protein YlmC with PRC-barrel domain